MVGLWGTAVPNGLGPPARGRGSLDQVAVGAHERLAGDGTHGPGPPVGGLGSPA